jgi:hypothetical protein
LRWFVGWYKGIDGVIDVAFAALGHDPDDLVQVSQEVIAETIRGYQTHPVHFLRDVLGNPFRPVSITPAWQTPDVLSLAQAAYNEHVLPRGLLDPARLAVLADALEEAGCSEKAILEHLRSPGLHVRGCWPVDLLLAKQ